MAIEPVREFTLYPEDPLLASFRARGSAVPLPYRRT